MKNRRLQIRVEPRHMEFLKEYSSKKNITISRMMRDFIDWLIRRESEGSSISGAKDERPNKN